MISQFSPNQLIAMQAAERHLKGVLNSSPESLEGLPVIRDPRPTEWAIEEEGQALVFDADAYNAWVQERLPFGNLLLNRDDKRVLTWRTHKAITRLVLAGESCTPIEKTGRHSLAVWDDTGRRAWAFFTGDVHIPILRDSKEVWMSLTPAELKTCWSGIEAAHGRVLIGGMGLGWMAQEILKKPSVESVTVVEIDPDIAEVFSHPIWGDPFAPHFDKWSDPIVSDLWQWLKAACEDGSALGFDSFILDIWPGWGEATDDLHLAEFKKWAAPFEKTVWAWGDIPNEVVANHVLGRGLHWIEHPEEPAIYWERPQ